jgi:hypothetical protein
LEFFRSFVFCNFRVQIQPVVVDFLCSILLLTFVIHFINGNRYRGCAVLQLSLFLFRSVHTLDFDLTLRFRFSRI